MPATPRPRVILRALGHFHPEHRIENEFFDSLEIDSDAHWVMDRTGIKSRHSVISKDDILALRYGRTTLERLRAEGKVMPISEMAYQAWQVLEQRLPGSDPKGDIDTLICGTSVPDFDIPANACTIAARMGLSCPAFDANSACSSFVVDLHLASAMLRSGMHRKIAIFNPERYSLRMNYEDKNSCVLFGDGCSTALVEWAMDGEGLELLDTYIDSDPSGYDLVKIPDGDVFSQNGKAVQKFAITRTIEATEKILERNGLEPADVRYFTGHQANLRMVASAAARLGLDEEKHLFNVDEMGNQGSAGAPSVLSMNWHRFKKGDIIVMAVVGSGLTWGSALFRKI